MPFYPVPRRRVRCASSLFEHATDVTRPSEANPSGRQPPVVFPSPASASQHLHPCAAGPASGHSARVCAPLHGEPVRDWGPVLLPTGSDDGGPGASRGRGDQAVSHVVSPVPIDVPPDMPGTPPDMPGASSLRGSNAVDGDAPDGDADAADAPSGSARKPPYRGRKGGTYRTAHAIKAACAEHSRFCAVMGRGFPIVVEDAAHEGAPLKRAVHALVRHAFAVKIVGHVIATKNVGFVLRIGCTRHGPRRHDAKYKESDHDQGCKWEVRYEATETGWVLVHCTAAALGDSRDDPLHVHKGDTCLGQHAHPLYADRIEMLAAAVGGKERVPPVLRATGTLLAASGLPICMIDKVLRQQALEQNVQADWDYRHLHYQFTPSAAAQVMSFKGIFAELQGPHRLLGLRHMVRTSEDGQDALEGLFVQLSLGIEEYALGGQDNTILFDPTHGTNLYKWFLCMFVTPNREGQTVILAYCYLAAQSADLFE